MTDASPDSTLALALVFVACTAITSISIPVMALLFWKLARLQHALIRDQAKQILALSEKPAAALLAANMQAEDAAISEGEVHATRSRGRVPVR